MKIMNSESEEAHILFEAVNENSRLNEEVSEDISINIDERKTRESSAKSQSNFQHFTYDSQRFDWKFIIRRLKWSFAVFCLMIGVFHVVNLVSFSKDANIRYVYRDLKFLADWRLLLIIVGIYVTLAVIKAYCISKVRKKLIY